MSFAVQSFSSSDDERLIRFKELSLRYVEIGRDSGVNIRPFMDPALIYYHKASREKQIEATHLLESIVSIHEETIASGEKPIESRFLLWRALKKLNLTPTLECFDHITQEDVVVIYDQNSNSIFWNLQFFKVISFTIEQLFFAPWPEITKREPHMQEQCRKLCEDVYSGKLSGNIFPDIPEHLVEELDSPEEMKTMMAVNFASTLQKEGKFAAFLVVQKMRIVS